MWLPPCIIDTFSGSLVPFVWRAALIFFTRQSMNNRRSVLGFLLAPFAVFPAAAKPADLLAFQKPVQ
jgi:hypothetical protein